jgi:hypothetical protein
MALRAPGKIARFLLAAHGSNRNRRPKGRVSSIIAVASERAPAKKRARQLLQARSP